MELENMSIPDSVILAHQLSCILDELSPKGEKKKKAPKSLNFNSLIAKTQGNRFLKLEL